MAELSRQKEQQVQGPWGQSWGGRSERQWGRQLLCTGAGAGLTGSLSISVWPGHTGSGSGPPLAESPAEMWCERTQPLAGSQAAPRWESTVKGGGQDPSRDPGGGGRWLGQGTAVVRSGQRLAAVGGQLFFNGIEMDCRERKGLAMFVRP